MRQRFSIPEHVQWDERATMAFRVDACRTFLNNPALRVKSVMHGWAISDDVVMLIACGDDELFTLKLEWDNNWDKPVTERVHEFTFRECGLSEWYNALAYPDPVLGVIWTDAYSDMVDTDWRELSHC
jgi:hypothetical protein